MNLAFITRRYLVLSRPYRTWSTGRVPVIRRKGRVIIGNIVTENEARRADAAGAGLTYGDFLARARFLC